MTFEPGKSLIYVSIRKLEINHKNIIRSQVHINFFFVWFSPFQTVLIKP